MDLKSGFSVVLGAFFTALVSAAFAISFAAIIYSGDLAKFLQDGIALVLLGAAVLGVVGTVTLSYRGSILAPQDVPAILLAASAASIATSTQLPDQMLFATVASLTLTAAILTGVVMIAVGRARLAHVARFFPLPVFAGFLATTGVLLLIGGVQIALGNSGIDGWFGYADPGALIKWLPVVLFALAIVIATTCLRGQFVLPIALIAVLCGFYAVYTLLGYSMTDMEDAGLLLGPFEEGGFFARLDPALPLHADWWAILWQFPTLATIAVSAVLGAALNASGLELALRRDLDLNAELQGAGLANVLGGAVGSIPGYHIVGETILAHRLGLRGAVPGLSAALGCAALLVMGAGVLTVLPVGFFATVIAFLGLDLIYTWLWVERRRFGKLDYAIVVTIPVVAVAYGFLTAIALGLMLACALFIYAYARLDIVRFESNLSTRRSRVERPASELAVLARDGQRAQVVELTGFLFFGSSNALRDRLRQTLCTQAQLRWLILDFTHVSGVDVSTRYVLDRMAADCEAAGVSLLLTGAKALGDWQGLSRIAHFATISDGIEAAETDLLAAASDPQVPAIDRDLDFLMADPAFCACVEPFSVLAGQPVVAPQAPASRDLFFLRAGRLRVTTGPANDIEIATVQPGAFVGELASYTGGTRSAAVSALSNARLLRIRAEKLDELEATHPDLTSRFHRMIARNMAHRLVRTTNLLRDLGV